MTWRQTDNKPLPEPILTVHRRIYAALGGIELIVMGDSFISARAAQQASPLSLCVANWLSRVITRSVKHCIAYYIYILKDIPWGGFLVELLTACCGCFENDDFYEQNKLHFIKPWILE